MIKRTYLFLATAVATLSVGAAQAASDYLIHFDGISGTSDIIGFEDYIEIESYSLGFVRGACQDLHFVKQMDASSAPMTGATILGTFIPQVILVARKPGERPFTYFRLTLTNSVFTSFQSGGTNGSGVVPMEQISVQPSTVKFESFEQDATGAPKLVASNTVTCQKVK
jgi:type VI secretion system secreted protein Hcp